MPNWTKESFIEDLRKSCSREVAKIGVTIIEFAEKNGEELTWGRGSDHGTLTYRCASDTGPLPLFHLTSDGQINFQINFMRNKEIPFMVLQDMVIKLEANFLRDYNAIEYPSDVFVPIDELFYTENQVVKFLKTMEGCTYRLKQ